MKSYPKMPAGQFTALKKQAERHDKADREVDRTEDWGDAHWNATHERMTALGAWLDLLPFRLFYSERSAAIQYTRSNMEHAHRHLLNRIEDFDNAGKEAWMLTEMYYLPSSGYFRCLMRVDGVRYAWYKAGPGHIWETGDNMNLQAAASRVYDNWDTMTPVQVRVTYTPTHSILKEARRWADLVYVTAYTTYPVEELTNGIDLKHSHIQLVTDAQPREEA